MQNITDEEIVITFGSNDEQTMIIVNIQKETPFNAAQVLEALSMLTEKVTRDGDDIFIESIEDQSGKHSLN